ncbi:MAG: hypothetical protein Phog2KO_39070 [Phototrophicaceae bacterium]
MLLRLSRQQGIIIMMLFVGLSFMFVPSATAQESNLCRDTGAPTIDFGETVGGAVDINFPFMIFCFEAERATEITVTIEPTSSNLFTAFIVGTPFINDATGALSDEPLLDEIAPAPATPYQGTTTITSDGTYVILVESLQETQGSFNITLEQSGGSVLGAENATEVPNTSTQGDGIDTIIYGQTDLCTTSFSTDIAYGETIDGSVTATTPLYYCFEANEADIVTINIAMIGDVPPAYFVTDPFFDNTADSFVLAQAIVQSPATSTSSEFIVPASGRYVVIVFVQVDAASDFSLSISGIEGNIYNCQNEPLSTLTSRQWGVMGEDGETPVIEINIACSERLSVATFGGATVSAYSVTQDDEFFFLYQQRVYVTQSLTDTEWVIEREDGQQYTLQAITDGTSCADDATTQLIQGSWLWQPDPTQTIFFDFTCDGIAMIDVQQEEAFATDYSFDGEEIIILLGETPLIFENVILEDASMTVTLQGIEFALQNLLYDAPLEEE